LLCGRFGEYCIRQWDGHTGVFICSIYNVKRHLFIDDAAKYDAFILTEVGEG